MPPPEPSLLTHALCLFCLPTALAVIVGVCHIVLLHVYTGVLSQIETIQAAAAAEAASIEGGDGGGGGGAAAAEGKGASPGGGGTWRQRFANCALVIDFSRCSLSTTAPTNVALHVD